MKGTEPSRSVDEKRQSRWAAVSVTSFGITEDELSVLLLEDTGLVSDLHDVLTLFPASCSWVCSGSDLKRLRGGTEEGCAPSAMFWQSPAFIWTGCNKVVRLSLHVFTQPRHKSEVSTKSTSKRANCWISTDADAIWALIVPKRVPYSGFYVFSETSEVLRTLVMKQSGEVSRSKQNSWGVHAGTQWVLKAKTEKQSAVQCNTIKLMNSVTQEIKK